MINSGEAVDLFGLNPNCSGDILESILSFSLECRIAAAIL